MNLFNFRKSVDLSGYTFLIPSVSVGNVPQLTIDLLISTLKLQNVATLWHPALVPSVCGDPFNNDNVVCTAGELYISEKLKIAALQIRSTLEPKLVLKFFKELIDNLCTFKLDKLYILATGFDYELHNIANKNLFYYIQNTSSTVSTQSPLFRPLGIDPSGKLIVNGSGYGTRLYEAIEDKIDCCLFTQFVSEGDNTSNAISYYDALLNFAGIKDEEACKLVFPSSWHLMFGAPPPVGIY